MFNVHSNYTLGIGRTGRGHGEGYSSEGRNFSVVLFVDEIPGERIAARPRLSKCRATARWPLRLLAVVVVSLGLYPAVIGYVMFWEGVSFPLGATWVLQYKFCGSLVGRLVNKHCLCVIFIKLFQSKCDITRLMKCRDKCSSVEVLYFSVGAQRKQQ